MRAPGVAGARGARPAPVAAALVVAAASLGVAGCADFRVPGQGGNRDYKGEADPLVMELPPEAESALAERFERVQAR